MHRSASKQPVSGGKAKRRKRAAVEKRRLSSIGKIALTAVVTSIITLVIPRLDNRLFVPDNRLEALAPPASNSLQQVDSRMAKADSQDFASVFHHNVQVTNKGSQTAHNIKLSIEPSSHDEELQLERVSTSPAGWEHIVNARDSTKPEHPYVHIVELDQLGPQQTLILDYVGRSKSYIPTSYLAVKAAAKEYKEMVRPSPGLILSANRHGFGNHMPHIIWLNWIGTYPSTTGLVSNDDAALASTTAPTATFFPREAIEGIHKRLNTSFRWDITGNIYADWPQVAFAGSNAMHDIDVYTLQNSYTNGSEVLSGNGQSVSNVNPGSGSWQIYVQDSAGSSAHSAAFTVQASSPTVSGYLWTTTPGATQNFNGTITGTNFVTGCTQVFFCVNGSSTCSQQPATGVTVNSSSDLSISNATLGSGFWQIYVQPLAGSSARSAAFSLQALLPTVDGYSWTTPPGRIQNLNGTITGTDFDTGGTQVLFINDMGQNSWEEINDGIGSSNCVNFVSWPPANNVSYFYFDPLDEAWKANCGDGPQGAYWGVWDNAGVPKSSTQNLFEVQAIADNSAGVPGGLGTTSILFPYVAPYGSSINRFGQEFYVNPDDHKVAVYMHIRGWWTKPMIAKTVSVTKNAASGERWVCVYASDFGSPVATRVYESGNQVIQGRGVANEAKEWLSNRDHTLRIKVLESGGTRLEVQSTEDREYSASPVIPPTRPVRVNIVDNGGSQLSIVTSVNTVRSNEPAVELRKERVSGFAGRITLLARPETRRLGTSLKLRPQVEQTSSGEGALKAGASLPLRVRFCQAFNSTPSTGSIPQF